MLGKKKEHSLFNEVDDNRTVVYDFRLRHFYESYRAVQYRLYHKLTESEMLPKLEDHLTKLLTGNSVDQANGDMLDTLLIGVAREALADLNRQHNNHQDMLRRLILRHKSDREDICKIKDQREAEYASLKSDYEKICRLLAKECKEVNYEQK